MTELNAEFLFEMTATLNTDAVQDVGDAGAGRRSIVEVTGGTFEGPHMHGKVLPFGADWVMRRTDGVSQLDVRITLLTDDGATIFMHYPGLLHTDSLGPLGDLPDGERYFRTTPRFETGAEQYRWLNRILAVGVGQPSEPGMVRYRIYAVL